jgi:hypothetical protein
MIHQDEGGSMLTGGAMTGAQASPRKNYAVALPRADSMELDGP